MNEALSRSRRWLHLGAAALGTLAAWVFFAVRPPMHAMVGLREIDALVPAHYQASAFPSYCAFLSALALDAWGRRARGTLSPRAALVALTVTLSAIRLSGALPLSGHALFLSAALCFDAASRRAGGERDRMALSALGLAVTAYYKLAVWDDAFWLVASLATGGMIGLGCALWARRRAGSLAA